MKCYANCIDECEGGASREHYISRSVLEIADSKLKVSGFPWQDPRKQADIGIETLTSKMFCVRHKSKKIIKSSSILNRKIMKIFTKGKGNIYDS